MMTANNGSKHRCPLGDEGSSSRNPIIPVHTRLAQWALPTRVPATEAGPGGAISNPRSGKRTTAGDAGEDSAPPFPPPLSADGSATAAATS